MYSPGTVRVQYQLGKILPYNTNSLAVGFVDHLHQPYELVRVDTATAIHIERVEGEAENVVLVEYTVGDQHTQELTADVVGCTELGTRLGAGQGVRNEG